MTENIPDDDGLSAAQLLKAITNKAGHEVARTKLTALLLSKNKEAAEASVRERDLPMMIQEKWGLKSDFASNDLVTREKHAADDYDEHDNPSRHTVRFSERLIPIVRVMWFLNTLGFSRKEVYAIAFDEPDEGRRKYYSEKLHKKIQQFADCAIGPDAVIDLRDWGETRLMAEMFSVSPPTRASSGVNEEVDVFLENWFRREEGWVSLSTECHLYNTPEAEIGALTLPDRVHWFMLRRRDYEANDTCEAMRKESKSLSLRVRWLWAFAKIRIKEEEELRAAMGETSALRQQ